MKIKVAGLIFLLTLSQGCLYSPPEFMRISRNNARLDGIEADYSQRNKVEGGYRVGEYFMGEKEYKWILEDSQYLSGSKWFSLSDPERDESISKICSELDRNDIISSKEF